MTQQKSPPPIYLDSNATTALDPRVLDAIKEELCQGPSNPSSIHCPGREARSRLTKAREEVAAYLEVETDEILFTSGGTEALNLAICNIPFKGAVLSTRIEHAAVFNSLNSLNAQVRYLPIGLSGHIDPTELTRALTPDVGMLVIGAANSETGVKTPLKTIAALALDRKIPLIVDGVALLGKEPFSIPEGVRAMAFSGHKIHGPKGIGCLFLRRHTPCTPLIWGGGQEFGRRGGTENLPGIVGFARAIELLNKELPAATQKMERLRNLFESRLENATLVGMGPRLCNTSCLTFPGVDGESLLIQLDMAGVYASMGSACSAGAIEPSRILLEMGLTRDEARSTLRFSLSRFTTEEEVCSATQRIKSLALQLAR